MKLRSGMKCPVCESGEIQKVRGNVDFEYKGENLQLVNATMFECSQCRESFFDDKHEREIERSLTDHRRAKDNLLTTDQIRDIRKSFGMTQVQFAKALGVGEKNFARYECGQTTQGRTMDNLLRILGSIPDALRLISEDIPVRGDKEKTEEGTIEPSPVESAPEKDKKKARRRRTASWKSTSCLQR